MTRHAAARALARWRPSTGRCWSRRCAGSPIAQIRNRGTVGGSCAHADPAAELPVVLTALDARFRVALDPRRARARARRRCSSASSNRRSRPDELLVEIEVPALPPGPARPSSSSPAGTATSPSAASPRSVELRRRRRLQRGADRAARRRADAAARRARRRRALVGQARRPTRARRRGGEARRRGRRRRPATCTAAPSTGAT